MHKLGVGVVALALVVGAFAPTAFAQDATTTDPTTVEQIADLLQQIKELQDQILALQAQQGDFRQQLVDAVQLTRSLSRGMSGDDVTALQELLASDPELYPEGLVTGFFGSLTEQAVIRLQAKFGIEQVGIVGPITRGTLNQLFKHPNRGHGNIFDFIFDDDDATSTDDMLPGRGLGRHKVRICHGGKTLVVGAPAVQAHLAHGDSLGACDTDDNDNDDDDEDVADEDSAQRAIDSAQSAIDDAQEAIDDADADGKDVEDAQELLDDAQALLDEAQEKFDDEEWEDAEEKAEDAEEKAEDAVDAIPADEDTDDPVITNIETADLTATSITISWDTDEDADSTVWFGTSTPLDTDGADSEHDGSATMNHEVELTGLTADTTYYFVVGSEDESGNEAMSNEQTFSTPAA